MLQGEVETLRELNSKLTAEIEDKNMLIKDLETRVAELEMESKSGHQLSRQLSKSEVRTEVIERETATLTRSEMNTVAVDCIVDEVTCDSGDVTRDCDDVTRDSGKSSRTDDESTAEMSDRDSYKDKYESLAAEQEDLLILLAHQDKDITALKERLRSLGEVINSSSPIPPLSAPLSLTPPPYRLWSLGEVINSPINPPPSPPADNGYTVLGETLTQWRFINGTPSVVKL
eukprot:sb/3469458/